MTIIELAREFGAKIQQTEEYAALDAAREANDKDEALQDMIAEFNTMGLAAEQEADKESPDDAVLDKLNVQLTSLYKNIMSNKNMSNFNGAKGIVDHEMEVSMEIISSAINGEDPATYEPQPHSHGCGGECGGCGSGCH